MWTRRAPCAGGRFSFWLASYAVLTVAVVLATSGPARAAKADDIFAAVVKVTTEVPPEARTARFLGTKREGTGVVIDGGGLVLTIGYLILESMGAEITVANGQSVQARFVAYDHETGFGLLRAVKPLGVKPLTLGDSSKLKERDQVLVANFGGPTTATGAFVVARRDFAGYWEYLLEDAIFTSPPNMNFGGAALIGPKGELMGIGSLIVPNAMDPGKAFPGNMFIPIDALKPIFGDLLARGRSAIGPRPWLGLYAEEHRGRLFVVRVPPGGPAAAAGLRPGDIVLTVGGKTITGLADFYRKTWALGKAGITVPLTILRDNAPSEVGVKSMDRYDWLKMNMSY